MRHIIFTLLCAAIPIVCAAQGDRGVNGVVFDENGAPVADAVIKAVGTDFQFKTNSDGTFVIAIPYSVKSLQVFYPGYFSKALEIDGSYLVFRLRVDKDYAARKARAEVEARAEAERKKKAEEEARLAAELAAAQEAEAKAWAEEEARWAAEEEARLAAEEEARLAAERAAAEAKAERLAKRKAIDDAYNAKYKNKGLIHALELSYLCRCDIPEHWDVVYKNLGYRYYGFVHPVQLTYTLGYRFNNWFALGIGTGIQYQLVNLCTYGDVFSPIYSNAQDYTPINIPVFVNARAYMSRGKYQPLLSLSGGVYAPYMEPLVDIGAGANIRLSRTGGMYFIVSLISRPYGCFVEHMYQGNYVDSDYAYRYYSFSRFNLSFKLGFTF